MDFLFFDDLRKKPVVIPSTIIVSTLIIFLVNLLGVQQGITYVLPHLFYIPIILTAYYYPHRGTFFAAGIAICYCIASFIVITPTETEVLSAIARSGVFILIGWVVSFLSGRMHQDTQMCRRLVSVVRSSADAITGETPEGIVTDWNTGAENLYGYPSSEMMGTSIFRLIPPELHEEKRLLLTKILTGETIERVETQRIKKDGTRILVSLSLSPIYDSMGKIVGVSDIAHDITERTRFQNEILREKNRWELTFDAVPDMIAIIDENFRIIQVNRAMADRLGVSPADAVGLACYEVVHHTNNPVALCPHQLLLRDGNSHSTDIHEDNLNGDFFLTVSPIRDPSGAVLGSVHILRDISERKRAEKQVQDSEKKFREIFNSANDGIHLYEFNDNGQPGRFIDVNDVVCRMVQYRKEELLDMSPLDLMTDSLSRPPEQISEEIKTKNSAIFETEYRRKDGSVIPVEVSVHVVVIQGKKQVLSVIRDLTQRKRAEEALRQSETKYHTLFEGMLEGFAYCHMIYNEKGEPADWVYLSVNPAFELLTGLKDITGKRVLEAIPNVRELTPELFDTYGRVASTGEPETFEIDFKPLKIWLKVSVFSPEREYFVVVFEDISERKRVEESLTLASKKLNLLSSITRHDIRNQLTALNGYIELSEEAIDKPADLREFLAKEQKIADAIARQITFTKDYENLGVKSASWFDVSALVRDAGTALPMRNIALEIQCAGLEIFADPLIEKVFYNLIDNSLHYGGNTMTEIRVTAGDAGDAGENLRIFFEDNGNGISVADKKQLFTKGFGKHTGLGLFLSREILSITGITITETGEPGRGARFEIVVPKNGYRFSS